MLKMKTEGRKTIINDDGYITECDSLAEAFHYLSLRKLVQEIEGTLPTEHRETVTSLIPPECKKRKRVRYTTSKRVEVIAV